MTKVNGIIDFFCVTVYAAGSLSIQNNAFEEMKLIGWPWSNSLEIGISLKMPILSTLFQFDPKWGVRIGFDNNSVKCSSQMESHGNIYIYIACHCTVPLTMNDWHCSHTTYKWHSCYKHWNCHFHHYAAQVVCVFALKCHTSGNFTTSPNNQREWQFVNKLWANRRRQIH